MTQRHKDYLFLALGVSPLVAAALSVVAFANNVFWLFSFLICYAASASIGCVRVLVEIMAHGVHNDR